MLKKKHKTLQLTYIRTSYCIYHHHQETANEIVYMYTSATANKKILHLKLS